MYLIHPGRTDRDSDTLKCGKYTATTQLRIIFVRSGCDNRDLANRAVESCLGAYSGFHLDLFPDCAAEVQLSKPDYRRNSDRLAVQLELRAPDRLKHSSVLHFFGSV